MISHAGSGIAFPAFLLHTSKSNTIPVFSQIPVDQSHCLIDKIQISLHHHIVILPLNLASGLRPAQNLPPSIRPNRVGI